MLGLMGLKKKVSMFVNLPTGYAKQAVSHSREWDLI
jgi:hypothetical protein